MPGRELEGSASVAGRGQDYGVGAVSVARFADDLLELVRIGAGGRTQTAGEVSTSGVDVDPDGTAAGRANELGGELADEPETDDDRGGACIESRDPNAMSGDRSDSGERPETILQRIREGEAQGAGTTTRSAWQAAFAPTQATRSPTRTPLACGPSASTTPALE